jgi:hypothetical protein
MFGWLLPSRCPVGTQEKAWIERRMLWLAEQFGRDRLLSAVFVLPDDRHFPDPYDRAATGARRLLDRLCGFMGVDPATVDLEVGTAPAPAEKEPVSKRGGAPSGGIQERPGGVVWTPTGIQEQPKPARLLVRVSEDQLADPMMLAGALAHDLARVLLQGRLSPLEEDYELVTDLLPVYLGTGVFAANATLQEYYENHGQTWSWGMSTQSYLAARVFGYAMALFAWVRGEASPAWAKSLRTDAAASLRDGLRYLRKTGDSLFRPDTFGEARPVRPEEVMDRLSKGTASARLAALWDARDHGLLGTEWVEALALRLSDPDPAGAAEAARVLAGFGEAAAPALPHLRETLHASYRSVRTAAAWALGELRLEAAGVVPELCCLLEDPYDEAFAVAATALARYAEPLDPASLNLLLARLDVAFARGYDDTVAVVARALLATTADPERCIREYFEDNAEWRRLGLIALREFREDKEADSCPEPSQ